MKVYGNVMEKVYFTMHVVSDDSDNIVFKSYFFIPSNRAKPDFNFLQII